jgi:hypothetical protein
MTLHFMHRGEWYKVKETGEMTQENRKDFSGEWIFKGVSFHHWRNGIDMTLKECFECPRGMCQGLVWDVDHGTPRQWLGSYYGRIPRVSTAYVD